MNWDGSLHASSEKECLGGGGGGWELSLAIALDQNLWIFKFVFWTSVQI